MNKIKIFLVAATLLLSEQSFSQTTKATIQGEISSSTANGLLGGTILNNIVLSYVDWTTCSGTGGIVYWNAGIPTCLNAGNNGYTLTMVSGIPQWSVLGIAGGGTNCSVASGSCLDNITGFSTTGYINRTGSGAYTFSTIIPVSSGGTGLSSGTSGGVLAFTGPGTIASSGVLAQYGIVVGGGAGAAPSTVTNGTAGQLFIAQTSANPAWSTLSGDATLTSGGAITVNASAITNSKLANAGAYTFKGNTTSSPAAPTDFTPGSLANKASPAASDYVVIADNAASGALKYATVAAIGSGGSGTVSAQPPQERITLTTGVPITTTDVAGATAHFVTPIGGGYIPIYNGSIFNSVQFSEVTQATTDTTKSPGAVIANKVYDIFCWVDSGTNRCTRGPPWSSDTSRGTGAGTSEVTLIQGIYVNANAITNGPAANLGTLVGSVRSNVSSQFMDTAAFRWTSNAYNCVPRPMAAVESAASWGYTTSTFRQANGNGANQLDLLQTLAGNQLNADVDAAYSNTSTGQFAVVGIDIDNLNTTAIVNNINTLMYDSTANLYVAVTAKYNGYPGFGRHTAIWKEYSSSTGSGTFLGTGGGAVLQSGIYGSVCN